MPRIGETSHNFLKVLIGKVCRIELPIHDVDSDSYYTGELIAFDEFTLIINCHFIKKPRLIYKSAIESICEA